ncbi:MAG: hypothetical protein JWN44_661 [Myxococcales bacterium]|nr:hypothetical protein [Myxococcales bacterium]
MLASETDIAPLSPRRVVDGERRRAEARREPRLEVSTLASVVGPTGLQLVHLVGLSAKSAEVVAPTYVGSIGDCLDLLLPVVGGRELVVPAGIVSTGPDGDRERVALEFMIAEVHVRHELNELLALLLAGRPDAVTLLPRVIYDTVAVYGPAGQRRGHLEELSLTGLAIRTTERLAHGFVMTVAVPAYRTAATLMLEGRVDGQQLSPDGGYRTVLSFGAMSAQQRRELGALLADLMCR